jgi:hypothetical protein
MDPLALQLAVPEATSDSEIVAGLKDRDSAVFEYGYNNYFSALYCVLPESSTISETCNYWVIPDMLLTSITESSDSFLNFFSSGEVFGNF